MRTEGQIRTKPRHLRSVRRGSFATRLATPRIPPDFRQALAQSGLLGFFLECVYVHRTGYLGWIETATRVGTRQRRIKQSVMRLLIQRAELAAEALAAALELPAAKKHAPRVAVARRCA